MENGSETETRKSAPSIRTMKSDISEFLKTAKPSLISILSGQARWEGHRDIKTKSTSLKIAAAAIGIGIITAGIAAIYFQFRSDSKPEPDVPRESIASPPL